MRTKEAGQAATEFAICLPLLCFMLMGVISYGQMIWADMELASATRDGARKAAVARNDTDPVGETKQATLQSLDHTKQSAVTVTVSCGWHMDDKCIVSASQPYALNIMGIEVWNGNLTNASTVRIG